jgi:hypothetical protein
MNLCTLAELLEKLAVSRWSRGDILTTFTSEQAKIECHGVLENGT